MNHEKTFVIQIICIIVVITTIIMAIAVLLHKEPTSIEDIVVDITIESTFHRPGFNTVIIVNKMPIIQYHPDVYSTTVTYKGHTYNSNNKSDYDKAKDKDGNEAVASFTIYHYEDKEDWIKFNSIINIKED